VSGHFDTACALLVAEVHALADVLSLELLPAVETVPGGELVIGSIGFCGDDLRGAVTLAAGPPVWLAIAPSDLGQPVPAVLLSDMVGELCNLALGRFRNVLLRKGVKIACATPTTAHGRLHDMKCICVQHSTWRTFRSSAGDLYLRFDASFESGFAFRSEAAVEPVVQDLVLF
jgi:CheY-specific phosphatase CheX